MMKKLITIISFSLYCHIVFGQVVENVNFAFSTHPMKINRIESLPNQFLVKISIENQIENGNFCADKNIDLIDILNKNKWHLIKAEGIPVCPANYHFTYVGEVLNFTLIFPKIATSTKYINIIENCSQYCFTINGIIVDQEMNKQINLGYDYYAKGNLDFALSTFRLIVENNNDYPFGFLYFNIIQILTEKQDFTEAKKWYSRLNNSNFLDKKEVLDRLKKQEFYQKIISDGK